MHVPLLERGHILFEVRSRDLRTGRAPKDLKISLSKLFSLKFNCVSLLIFDKQLDSEEKKKSIVKIYQQNAESHSQKKEKNVKSQICF